MTNERKANLLGLLPMFLGLLPPAPSYPLMPLISDPSYPQKFPSYLWVFPRVSHMYSQTSLASLHLVLVGHLPFAALAPIFSVLSLGHCCVHQAPQSLLQQRKSLEGAKTMSCCSIHWQRMPLHLYVYTHEWGPKVTFLLPK